MPISPDVEAARRRRWVSYAVVLAAVAAVLVAAVVAASLIAARGSHVTPVVTRTHSSRPRASSRVPVHIVDPVAVPILMYHHVAPRREGSPLLWVSRAQFAAELAYLRGRGYHAVTMEQVYACWTQGRALPARPVVLSFDDGYVDQYRYAAPLLRRYRDAAVLNLIVHNLGRALTIEMVSRMATGGWEIDSHTITHRDLALLPGNRLRYELKGSRDLLQRYFEAPVDFFCYPGGAYDAAVVAAVRRAGYLAATSVRYGLARPSELFALRRIVVFGGESLALYGRSLSGSARAGAALDRTVGRAGL